LEIATDGYYPRNTTLVRSTRHRLAKSESQDLAATISNALSQGGCKRKKWNATSTPPATLDAGPLTCWLEATEAVSLPSS
jgi:hypothetical protein